MKTNTVTWIATFIILLVLAGLAFHKSTNASIEYQEGFEVVIEKAEVEEVIDPDIILLSKYINYPS